MSNSFPFSDPVAISRSTANSLGVEMIDLRRGLGALSAPSYGDGSGTLSGVFPGGTAGAGPSNDLGFYEVSARTVSFHSGHFACDRGSGNLYLGMAYAGWSLTLDAGDAVNPRIDMVVLRVRDPAGLDTPGTGITESVRPTILKGTPAANPAKPTGQLTDGDVPLWSFTVGGGSNSNAIIANADERLFVEARGAVRTRRGSDPRPGAYEGQVAYNVDSHQYEGWNGSQWLPWGMLTGWQSFTPQLYYGGDGKVSGTGLCSLGPRAVIRGRYQVIGKRLDISVTMIADVTGVNMGAGIINSLLPPGIVSRPAISGDNRPAQQFFLNLYDAQGYSWPGMAGVRDNSNVVSLAFPINSTTCLLDSYVAATSPGARGTGTPRIGEFDGTGFPNPGILSWSGFLEIS